MPDTDVQPKTLRTAAGQGEEMQSGVASAISALNAHHQGLPGQTAGFSFAQQLMRTQHSWQARLGDVRNECGDVAQSLRKSADNYETNDDNTARSFTQRSESLAMVRPAAQSRHNSPFG
ncbi:type VII secretion target [Streptomyces benahoarensis]|uniref:type VII secretion target n=1 Tax=Streptomyces benahoarensis TaxID=2595054 RepID=UPI00163D432F|nr:type VII secretion target [Streptomyces benahoarensis]